MISDMTDCITTLFQYLTVKEDVMMKIVTTEEEQCATSAISDFVSTAFVLLILSRYFYI